MLEKIQEIKGIKRFYDVNNINFGSSKIIIFFGENGSGKTTLSKLLKALHDKDTERVSSLKHDEGKFIKTNLIFNNGNCVDCIINDNAKRINGEFPTALEVFNIDFINNYVYLGHEVTADQKSNLYKFVFGEHQVQLQQEIDEILEKIKELNTKIQEKEAELIKLAHIPKEKVENFVKMNVKESIHDLENRINQLNIKLKNVQENEYIHKLGTLEPISTKDAEKLVSNVRSICVESLENLQIKTLKRFKEHLHVIGSDKREWLKNGYQLVKGKKLNICPFCGQDIRENSLIQEYEVAFNEEYIAFTKRLDKLSNQINQFSLSYIIEIVNRNDKLIQEWSKYTDGLEIPQLRNIQQLEKEIKNEIVHLLEEKRKNIFISINNFEKINFLLQQLNHQVNSYNINVKNINAQIAKFKENLSKESTSDIESKIKEIELRIKRKRLDYLCKEYTDLILKKRRLEQEKRELMEKLNEQMNELLNKYEKTINTIFEKFNTDYRIKSQKISTTRKRQTFEYGIQLNFSEDIKSNKKLGEILSEGDKTTLAFSVFIARLLLDDKLNEKIVVIDDPISSLDDFRINRTVDYIMRVFELTRQIIVLSHNPLFLKELLYRIKRGGQSSSSRFFKLNKKNKYSQIEELTYNQAESFIENKLTPYYKYFMRVIDIVNKWENDINIDEKDIDDAFNNARIVFEYYMKLKYPEDIQTPVGEIINKIANPDKKKFLNELYNALTKTHHSGTFQPSPQEKVSYLKDLINFIKFDKYS